MKTRLLIAAMSTVLLAGCIFLEPHPNCAPQQKAEKRNSKDLDAYCYTEATQDTLKCAKAKDERDHLRELRAEMGEQRHVPGSYFFFGASEYEKCESTLTY